MKVSIIMGSKSDWDVMSAACFALALFFSPVFLAVLFILRYIFSSTNY